MASFQLVENIDGYRNVLKLQNIGIQRLGRCTHSRNRIELNSGNKNVCAQNEVKCGYKIQIHILNCHVSPGLAQPVNRAASTTDITARTLGNDNNAISPRIRSPYKSWFSAMY